MLKQELYTYNEQGLRIKKEEFNGPNKKSTYYVYSGNDVLFTETYINDKPIDMIFNVADMASFTHHYGDNPQDELNYYYKDHRQNRIVKTEADGSIVSSANKFGYSSWGELDNSNATEESWFTGKKQDESGLYYFNARYYDAEMGRFLQEDSVKSGLNWYTYCNNDPINNSDSDGNAPGNIIKDIFDWGKKLKTDIVSFGLEIAITNAKKLEQSNSIVAESNRVMSSSIALAKEVSINILKVQGYLTNGNVPKLFIISSGRMALGMSGLMLKAIEHGIKAHIPPSVTIEIGFRPRHPLAALFDGFIDTKKGGFGKDVNKTFALSILGIRENEAGQYAISDLDSAYIRINGKLFNSEAERGSAQWLMMDIIFASINAKYRELLNEIGIQTNDSLSNHWDNFSGESSEDEHVRDAATAAAAQNDFCLSVTVSADEDGNSSSPKYDVGYYSELIGGGYTDTMSYY